MGKNRGSEKKTVIYRGEESWERLFASHWPIYLILISVGFVLYFKSLFFDFVYLDDNSLILENINFLKDLSNLPQAFFKDVFQADHGLAAYYRPMLTISFMFDALFGGEAPFFYHLSNLAIHIIASLLVFKLIFKLGYSEKISFLLAFVFSIHPVLTQAVSWVPGRNDSLLTVFVLASFIFFLNYFKREKLGSLVFSFLFFALALFTKESAILLPFFCLMYLWMRRSLTFKSFLQWIIGAGSIVAVWAVFRSLAFAKNPMPFAFGDIFWSVWKNFPASFQLLGKVFFPFNLSVLPNIPDTTFVWGALATIILLGVIAWEYLIGSFKKRRSLMFLFAFFWFGLFLAPSFVRPDPDIIADFIEHRLYLPIIGILIFIAEIRGIEIVNRIRASNYWIFLAIIFFFFGSLTFFHQSVFADKFAFWLNASENSPSSPLAQRNLGAMYHLEKKYDLAEKYYKRTIEINDLEPMVHSNLGLIYANRGDLAGAEREYLKELSFNPGYDNAHFNLGLLYYATKRIEQAKKEWQKTLEINPEYIDARNALREVQ